jgi:hypothetical protein
MNKWKYKNKVGEKNGHIFSQTQRTDRHQTPDRDGDFSAGVLCCRHRQAVLFACESSRAIINSGL